MWWGMQKQEVLMQPVLNLLVLRYLQETQMEMPYLHCSAHHWC